MEENKKVTNETPSVDKNQIKEQRHALIYGYSREEMRTIMRHFEAQLPDYIKLTTTSNHLVTNITLTGINEGAELLRFKMSQYLQHLQYMFSEEIITTEDKSIAQVLGDLLNERELTICCAESCTGGNIAHKITQMPGSSAYFLGSVVSYSNDVKANVLNVSRNDIARHGAVSKAVVEQMATGVSKLMRSYCSVATSGIAGPDGGSTFKPVGTVWMAAKYGDHVVSELKQFKGDRNDVIECATDHVMVMLIKILRNSYIEQDDINDD